MKKNLLTVAICLIAAIFTGCTSTKQMTLFSGSKANYKLHHSQPFILREGDMLNIYFTAINSEAAALYNSAGNSFLIDSEGNITLPIIGKVNVVGKTEKEAAQMLEDKLKDQIKNPYVLIFVSNANITVLGEVRSPQRIKTSAPITIIEAIGAAGDFTTNARRDNIMVQRWEGQQIKIYRVNMLSDEVFSSPCYFLQKGDVVYVSPLHPQKH